jgi:hypothetical protein
MFTQLAYLYFYPLIFQKLDTGIAVEVLAVVRTFLSKAMIASQLIVTGTFHHRIIINAIF